MSVIPASFARKTVAILILVALLCAAGFFASYSYQVNKSHRAKLDGAVSSATERIGKTSTREAISALEREHKRDNQTIENRNKINEAENANDSAGDAGNIGLGVLCERPSYRHDPACLQRKNPAASQK